MFFIKIIKLTIIYDKLDDEEKQEQYVVVLMRTPLFFVEFLTRSNSCYLF